MEQTSFLQFILRFDFWLSHTFLSSGIEGLILSIGQLAVVVIALTRKTAKGIFTWVMCLWALAFLNIVARVVRGCACLPNMVFATDVLRETLNVVILSVLLTVIVSVRMRNKATAALGQWRWIGGVVLSLCLASAIYVVVRLSEWLR